MLVRCSPHTRLISAHMFMFVDICENVRMFGTRCVCVECMLWGASETKFLRTHMAYFIQQGFFVGVSDFQSN